MKTKCVIIGGGVAGLCAAIRLSELGKESLIIEGGSYPAHKVCGEFLSPECLPSLHAWNIHPVSIPKLVLNSSKSSLEFAFPSPGGALSHIHLDPALLNHALSLGAKIKTQTLVDSIVPKQHPQEAHRIKLSNGESIEASQVIFASGRIPSYTSKPPPFSYIGFKAHFKNISKSDNLEVFSLPGAYLGIAPIEENKLNVACLATLRKVNEWKDPQKFIQSLISKNPYLDSRLSDGENLFGSWMVASLPEFGFKQTPDWLDTYFIGDAALTIPPASGSGLAMAIMGGRLAAEYASRNQTQDFKKIWIKRCSSQLFWAKHLHRLMLNPSYGTPLITLAGAFPILANKAYAFTRQR